MWLEDAAKIKTEIHAHFKRHFSESSSVRPSFNNTNFLHLCDDQSSLLESPFSLEEVKSAVWACEGSKAPGPDGFDFTFIKAHWDTIKDDVLKFVKDFEETGLLPRGCNSTFIMLIPKVKDPLTLSDYRPISLVGCQYKIISKVLAERLKAVLR